MLPNPRRNQQNKKDSEITVPCRIAILSHLRLPVVSSLTVSDRTLGDKNPPKRVTRLQSPVRHRSQGQVSSTRSAALRTHGC